MWFTYHSSSAEEDKNRGWRIFSSLCHSCTALIQALQYNAHCVFQKIYKVLVMCTLNDFYAHIVSLAEEFASRQTDSSQWCTVKGTKYKPKYRKFHLNIWKKTFHYRGGQMLTGCPERLWSVHAWRYSNASGTWPWAACASWAFLKQRSWTRPFPDVPANLSPSCGSGYCI